MCTEIHKELGHPGGNIIRARKNTCTKSKHTSMTPDQLCNEKNIYTFYSGINFPLMLDVLSVYIFPPFNINLQVQKSMIPAVKLEMARILKTF